MADEIVAPVAADAPAEIAPVAAVATPVEATPAAEVPAAEAAPVEATPAETTEGAPAEPAPATVVEAAAESTAETPAPAEAAPEQPPAPTYEAFKVPEGFTLPEERLTEFTGVLGKYGLTQEAGQELLDLHAATAMQLQAAMEQRQLDAFQDTRRTWREEFYRAAGNRSDTMANDAKWAITQLVKDTERRKELYSVLDYTGAGDHKAVVGLLAAAAKVMRERAAPPQGLAARAPERTAAQRRYDKQPAR